MSFIINVLIKHNYILYYLKLKEVVIKESN